MKKNKTLLLVNSKSIVDKLKEESSITFLFPVKGFCVGFENLYDISEISIDSYIFVNRILDNAGIEKFREFIKNIPNNIKGIVFDDIGVLNVLIKENIPITKILFLNHMNCNYESINAYLEYVDSAVISPDITIDEIKEILAYATKPVVLYTFGHMNIMYSRRTLLTNYNKHFNSDVGKLAALEEEMQKTKFKIIENEHGSVIYTNEPFNGLVLRKEDNVLFNLINGVFLSDEEIINIINSENNLENLYPYKYLSEKKTIFKLKGEE
ncbi:MAG: hypothetical protein E7163_00035 [Firmicutes bacterium]|nr:hypothetical protein [Bacillota bacterium]